MGKIDRLRLPKHIAIIMDGNGRWAKKRHLPKLFGHARGAKSVDEITEASRELGIKALTLYTFSTENWKRPRKEISGLMDLLCEHLETKYEKLQKNSVRLNAIGGLDRLPHKVKERLFDVMRKTSENDGMVLTLALNYGGRQEIVDAARAVAEKAKSDALSARDITEENFSQFLYTKDLPDVDLLIRTSGEMRVSNFMLWQISYAELYITDKLWPDFRRRDLEKAIIDYQLRERRYGA